MDYEKRLNALFTGRPSAESIEKVVELAIEVMSTATESQFMNDVYYRMEDSFMGNDYDCVSARLILAAGSDELIKSTPLLKILEHAPSKLDGIKDRLRHVIRVLLVSEFNGDGWAMYREVIDSRMTVDYNIVRAALNAIREECTLNTNELLKGDPDEVWCRKFLSILYQEDV